MQIDKTPTADGIRNVRLTPKLPGRRNSHLLLAVTLFLLISGCGDPQTATECIDLAEDHFNREKYSSALRLCDKAIELEPDNFSAYNIRAIVHGGLGNFQQSISDWTKAIEFAPDDATKAVMYTMRSYAYEAFGDPLNMAKDRVAAKKLELAIEDDQ